MRKRLATVALALAMLVGGSIPAVAHVPSGHPVCVDHIGKWVYGPSGYRHLTNRFQTNKAVDYVYVFFAGSWQWSHKHYRDC